MKNKGISNQELIMKGYLWVNIPAIIIILSVWFVLVTIINLNNVFSIFIGGALGWIYWEFLIRKWISWALNNDVDKERLYKIGKISLLLSNRFTIDKISNSKSNSKEE